MGVGAEIWPPAYDIYKCLIPASVTFLGIPCDRHDGKMKIFCAIHPNAIWEILDCLGLPFQPPLISSAVLRRDQEEDAPYTKMESYGSWEANHVSILMS
jgi:hypothetical protein